VASAQGDSRRISAHPRPVAVRDPQLTHSDSLQPLAFVLELLLLRRWLWLLVQARILIKKGPA
jgi:hypothetical protein